MAAVQTTTLAQRFGFQDKQLTTPAHDRLVLWAEKNILKTVNSEGRVLELELEMPIMQEKGEEGTKYYSKHIIGFIDIAVVVCNQKRNCLKWEDIRDKLSDTAHKKWQSKKGNKELSYWSWEHSKDYDRMIRSIEKAKAKWEETNCDCRHRTFYIEIKPIIESFGELIRQIHMYQTYAPHDVEFVVASPDTHFAGAIRKQGIRFYQIPSSVTKDGVKKNA